MKNAHRLARSGAISGAAMTKRERGSGLYLAGSILFLIGAILFVLSRACASTPVSALVVSAVAGPTPSTGSSEHELLIPFISQRWPPPPVLSNCTTEEPTCN